MSIIGHAIQTCLAHVHVALRQQQAGEVALSEEAMRRRRALRRERELARAAVRKAQEARHGRSRHLTDAEKRKQQPRERLGGTSPGHIDVIV